jgi:hypothetical protein
MLSDNYATNYRVFTQVPSSRLPLAGTGYSAYH